MYMVNIINETHQLFKKLENYFLHIIMIRGCMVRKSMGIEYSKKNYVYLM